MSEQFYDKGESEKQKTCRRCGTPNLMWVETENGWRLTEDGKTPHICGITKKGESSDGEQ